MLRSPSWRHRPSWPSEDPGPAAGQLVLDVAAVALNPVDVAIAAGTFYAGHPPLAYIPAIEAAGWVGDRFVYAQGSGRGVATDGFLAERAVVTEADLVELPDGTDPALAAALGVAGATAGWRRRRGPRSTSATSWWCSGRPAPSAVSPCRRRSGAGPVR